MHKRITVIGANGQLGHDLIKTLSKNFVAIAVNHKDLDITVLKQCKEVILSTKPNVVVNTAAYHNTVKCESFPQKAFKVNAVGAYNVAKVANLVGASVFYISTNYVFDGTKDVYRESDRPNPLNIYGASKFAGEILTKIGNENSYIIRTAGLFGIHPSGKGHNFITLMLAKAKRGNTIKVVNDEQTSVTYTLDLANKIGEFINKNPSFGIYHLANRGKASWFEIAKEIFKTTRLNVSISPISSSQKLLTLERPLKTALTSERLKASGIQPLRSWKPALRDYIDEIKYQI